MTDVPPIGLRIKRARERKRWTQRQLAQAVGVNTKTIDNYENGRTSPRNSIGALEEVLGISLDSGGEPEPAGPLADLLPPGDDWEAQVLADRDLSDDWKRFFIEGSRAARAAYAERKRSEAARSPRRDAG